MSPTSIFTPREKISETLTQSQFESTVDTIDAWLDSIRAYVGAPMVSVVTLSPTGTLLWSTMLGGSQADTGRGIGSSRPG